VFCPYTGELTYNAPMSYSNPTAHDRRSRQSPGRKLPILALLMLFTGLGFSLGLAPLSHGKEPLRIAVAANFRAAAEQLGERFGATTGQPVVVSSASTGVLAAQLRNGAPFDLLLAADQARPQMLVDEGVAIAPTRCYALGSLVLLGAESINAALADAGKSIAIANPRSAPYGAAALAVLERQGFADAQTRRVVMGSNVQQAYQFYAAGAADLGLVARSLSPQAGLPIPTDWHPRIEQHVIVSAASTQTALADSFIAYLLSPEAEPILQSFGYKSCL
jgi:molybdate transport system substrate-binding protein